MDAVILARISSHYYSTTLKLKLDMDNDQAVKFIIEAIPILRSQRKRPDRINIAKFVASKHGLSESVINETVAALLTDAVIYNKPTNEVMNLCMYQKGVQKLLA